MFPDYAFAALFPLYEKTKDVAKAATEILENFDPETDVPKSTDASAAGIPLASSSVLSARFDFIKTLNLNFCRVFDLINFRNTDDESSICRKVNLFRGYVLSVSNKKRFEDAMKKSACGESSSSTRSSDIEVVISRGRAAKFSQAGECDTKGLWSVFGQAFR